MNKKESFIYRKRYVNVPKYDLGVSPSGREYSPYGIDTSKFAITEGESTEGQDDAIKKSIIPDAISKGGTYYNTLKMNDNFKNISNVFRTSMPGIVSSAIPSAVEQSALKSLMQTSANSATGTIAEAAASGSLGSVGSGLGASELSPIGKNVATKSAAKTLGTAASIAGTLYGLYDNYNAFNKYYTDYRRAGDMMNSANKITQSTNGVNYNAYGGFNADNERRIASAQNTAGKINSTLSGAGLGASVGSLVGPIGTVVGGGIGALAGLVSGIFGSNHRKDEINRQIEYATRSMNAYNMLAQSRAASQGLRNEFNKTHADGGVDSYTTKGRYDKPGVVHTVDGKQIGMPNALIGKRETLYNFDEGKMHYNNDGKWRSDTVGAQLKQSDGVIGNEIDPFTGQRLSVEAEPLSIEYDNMEAKKRKIMSNKHTDAKTKKFNLTQIENRQQELMQLLRPIAERQRMIHNNNANGMIMADNGWLDTPAYAISSYLPIFAGIDRLYREDRNATPTAGYGYAANPNSQQALAALSQIRYNPYNDLRAANDANRQALYNINQTGAATAGQRMAMQSALNIANMKQQAAILNNAQQMNNQYRQAYANALGQYGEQEAGRMQQANMQRIADLKEAYGQKYKATRQDQMNLLNQYSQMISDITALNRYKQSREQFDRMLSLYENNPEMPEQIIKAKGNSTKRTGSKFNIAQFGKNAQRFIKNMAAKLNTNKNTSYKLSPLSYNIIPDTWLNTGPNSQIIPQYSLPMYLYK